MRQLSGDGAPAQRLLLPLTLDFSAAELEAVDAHGEWLRRVVWELEPFSGRSVVVHPAPNPHPGFDATRCLQELVADLAGGRFGGWANRLERFAASFACRAAIKAGQRLEPDEMRELVIRVLGATLPAHDVHGRPTIVQLPKDELERRVWGGRPPPGTRNPPPPPRPPDPPRRGPPGSPAPHPAPR